ncbi:MAG TPA: CDP-alcohol phosphatidyltransferase family protein [Gemmatimonadaceae bacterium]|nr:CDP-alcohol phosphatidyltransferase family protein [Gemmatimonadaceae bacterium]
MPRDRVLTLANLLSFARFPLAAAFVAVHDTTVRFWLIVAASATDLLDGWIARMGTTTRFGALLDPIADKTFILFALSAFLFNGTLSTGNYFIILSRDLATAVGFLVAYYLPGLDPTLFKARGPGKVVMALQLAALFVLLLAPHDIMWVTIPLAAASLWAIVDYTLFLARTRKHQ